MAGSIPVYVGEPSTIDPYVPVHSIIKTADFPDAQALATHLLAVASNGTKYEEYFAWQQQPLEHETAKIYQKAIDGLSSCDICTFVHTHRERRFADAEQCPHEGLVFSA